MEKLLKLLPAVLLAAAILAPHPVAAKPPTVVGVLNGGGTAEMAADSLAGAGPSFFGLAVTLLSDGSARGHFDCVDQHGDQAAGNIFGEVTGWTMEGDVFVLNVTGKVLGIPGGHLGLVSFVVKIQEVGGAGVGHWTLEIPGIPGLICDETVTSGEIVYHPA